MGIATAPLFTTISHLYLFIYIIIILKITAIINLNPPITASITILITIIYRHSSLLIVIASHIVIIIIDCHVYYSINIIDVNPANNNDYLSMYLITYLTNADINIDNCCI